jgi:hypothetical protein
VAAPVHLRELEGSEQGGDEAALGTEVAAHRVTSRGLDSKQMRFLPESFAA